MDEGLCTFRSFSTQSQSISKSKKKVNHLEKMKYNGKYNLNFMIPQVAFSVTIFLIGLIEV